jgi:hypothetical protein
VGSNLTDSGYGCGWSCWLLIVLIVDDEEVWYIHTWYVCMYGGSGRVGGMIHVVALLIIPQLERDKYR